MQQQRKRTPRIDRRLDIALQRAFRIAENNRRANPNKPIGIETALRNFAHSTLCHTLAPNSKKLLEKLQIHDTGKQSEILSSTVRTALEIIRYPKAQPGEEVKRLMKTVKLQRQQIEHLTKTGLNEEQATKYYFKMYNKVRATDKQITSEGI